MYAFIEQRANSIKCKNRYDQSPGKQKKRKREREREEIKHSMKE